MIFPLCDIKVKKREHARYLEKELGVSWSFDQQSPFDPVLHLRCCLPEAVNIKSNSTCYVPTGISIEIHNPNYHFEVLSHSELVYDSKLVVLDAPAIFDHTYRGEIYVMLHNFSDETKLLKPNDTIATLRLKHTIRPVIKYVDELNLDVPRLNFVKWISKFLKNKKIT